MFRGSPKLSYILFWQKIPLQVIELLAWNTKQLDDVFYYYAMEGKLIEMAALLMVAREKVLAAKMDIYQHIQEEILSITGDENELMKCNNGGRWASVIRDKRLGMMSALKLLEVFEKAGDRVEAYVQSVQSEVSCYHTCFCYTFCFYGA